jgi:hypothetical protein
MIIRTEIDTTRINFRKPLIERQTTILLYSLRSSDRDSNTSPHSMMKAWVLISPYIFVQTYVAWVFTISLDHAANLPTAP